MARNSLRAAAFAEALSRVGGAVQGLLGADRLRQEPGALPGGDQAELLECGANGADWRADLSRCCEMRLRRRCSRFWRPTRSRTSTTRRRSTLTIKDTGSQILFRAVEEFERLRGTNLAWFGLDELTYTQEAAWLRLEGRLRDHEGAAAVRIRGMDAEGLRLGVPQVRGAGAEGLRHHRREGVRKPAPAGPDSGLLRTAGEELRRAVLRAGSSGVVFEHGRSPGCTRRSTATRTWWTLR